ncbi:hypothetical protein FBU59_005955, partial [Linderina macrospora]
MEDRHPAANATDPGRSALQNLIAALGLDDSTGFAHGFHNLPPAELCAQRRRLFSFRRLRSYVA